MIKKLNWEIIIKILVLLGFSLFYCIIIINKKVMLYVHPRIIPFIIFGMISMALIALFLMEDIFVNNKRKIKISKYIVYILPLLMAFSIQAKAMNTDMLQNKNININQQSNNNDNLQDSSSLNNSSANNGIDTNKKQLDIENNSIIVKSENFVYSISEINDNIENYENKTVQITGFIYKNKNFKENEFVVARFMMICCTADMQVVGLLCDYKNAKSYSNDTWVKISGKVRKSNYQGQKIAILYIDSIEKISKPDNQYVYPF